MTRILLSLAFCAAPVWGACQPEAATSSAAPSEPPDPDRLWARNHATCHGSEGMGYRPGAGMERPANFTDAETQAHLTDDMIEPALRNGKGYMPAFPHL